MHTIINVSDSQRRRLSNRNAKWFTLPLIEIIVLLTFVSGIIFYFFTRFESNGAELFLKQILRKTTEIDNKPLISSNGISDNIIDDITKEKYIGNWTEIVSANDIRDNHDSLVMFNESQGRVDAELKLNKPHSALEIKVKCYKGKHIDNWLSFNAVIMLHSLSITNNIQSSLMLEGNYTSIESKGRLFNQNSRPKSK